MKFIILLMVALPVIACGKPDIRFSPGHMCTLKNRTLIVNRVAYHTSTSVSYKMLTENGREVTILRSET